jgi:RNase P protein component
LTKDIDLIVIPKRTLQPDKVSYWQVEKELAPLLQKIEKEYIVSVSSDVS